MFSAELALFTENACFSPRPVKSRKLSYFCLLLVVRKNILKEYLSNSGGIWGFEDSATSDRLLASLAGRKGFSAFSDMSSTQIDR